MVRCAVVGLLLTFLCEIFLGGASAQPLSRGGVMTPSRARDAVLVAGTTGIDPKTDVIVPGDTRAEIDPLNDSDITAAASPDDPPRKPPASAGETSGQHVGSDTEAWDMAMFDRFLAASPKYRRTPQPERQRLFREFQEWRRTQP